MWSTILSLFTGSTSSALVYVKIGLVTVLVCGVFYLGWHIRDRDFTEYKNQVTIAAEKQAQETESIKKQHALVTKGIEDEYNAKIGLIRQYYANGVRNPNGTGGVSSISTTSAIANATAAYNELAGRCAETTVQLVELQKWINEQVGIK